MLRLPYDLAPVKVAVCPLAKTILNPVESARYICQAQEEIGAVLWIDSGNIGKNYRKMDVARGPLCSNNDFDTLEGDTKDTVTVRPRDTTEQQRSKVINLIALLSSTQSTLHDKQKTVYALIDASNLWAVQGKRQNYLI
ncbi:hypothetical protein IPL68_04975 [Candidatus Saccharibacteria bacterium]|nr:MAG: hypothetical protein IPL68_04975 [Candidatus Saccharibacteria bacterium]